MNKIDKIDIENIKTAIKGLKVIHTNNSLGYSNTLIRLEQNEKILKQLKINNNQPDTLTHIIFMKSY
jgi:hypothetical protein